MRTKTILAVLVAGLIGCGLFNQAQATLVTGSITFVGTVQLDTASASTATKVTAWGGLGAGGKPQIASRDGGFTAFTTPGDAVTFVAPWSFNSGPVPSFWTVDGFTFDLIASSITSQGSGAVNVDGTGTISGNGFMATAGTWHFTTQDPSAGSPAQFSFSAAVGTPDGGTSVALLGVALAGIEAVRRRIYARKA